MANSERRQPTAAFMLLDAFYSSVTLRLNLL